MPSSPRRASASGSCRSGRKIWCNSFSHKKAHKFPKGFCVLCALLWLFPRMNLQNATALVTGGSSGIGLAIAKVLIDAGARVAITGRDEKKLYKAAQTLSAVPIHSDVTNETDVART